MSTWLVDSLNAGTEQARAALPSPGKRVAHHRAQVLGSLVQRDLQDRLSGERRRPVDDQLLRLSGSVEVRSDSVVAVTEFVKVFDTNRS